MPSSVICGLEGEVYGFVSPMEAFGGCFFFVKLLRSGRFCGWPAADDFWKIFLIVVIVRFFRNKTEIVHGVLRNTGTVRRFLIAAVRISCVAGRRGRGAAAFLFLLVIQPACKSLFLRVGTVCFKVEDPESLFYGTFHVGGESALQTGVRHGRIQIRDIARIIKEALKGICRELLSEPRAVIDLPVPVSMKVAP